MVAKVFYGIVYEAGLFKKYKKQCSRQHSNGGSPHKCVLILQCHNTDTMKKPNFSSYAIAAEAINFGDSQTLNLINLGTQIHIVGPSNYLNSIFLKILLNTLWYYYIDNPE